MKKVLSIILTVCLIAAMIPLGAVIASAESSLAKSVEIEDISLLEKGDGYYTYDENGQEYFEYFYSTPSYKVTLANGEVLESEWGGYIEIPCDDGEGLMIYDLVYDDKQYEKHWQAGNTYTVTAYILGVTGTFNVTIVESPVKSVEIENVSLIENVTGFYAEDENEQEYFEYDYDPSYRVTLKNGEVIESDEYGGIAFNDDWYCLDFEDNQYEEHWQLGETYTVTASILGVTGTFNASIIKNPIKKLDINELIIDNWMILEDLESGYSQLAFVGYPNFTVTLEDDSVIASDEFGCLKLNGGYYYVDYYFDYDAYKSDFQSRLDTPYTITGNIGDVSDDFNITFAKYDCLVGDLNEDGEVTDADAVYLLMYTFFPDDYPVNQDVDFNGDGIVTDADAVYLLMYTFFPEDYPI